MSYRHAWQHLHPRSYPYVVAHSDGMNPLKPYVAALGIERVLGSVETATGADKHMVAEYP